LASDRKLTVLQVLPALNAGGVERGTLEVGRHLVEQGHRSLVMSAGGRMVAQLEREGSTHIAWPIGKKSLWTLRLIWPLRRFLQEQQVDIVHVRSRMPAWVVYLAWKGMDPATRPHLVTTVHGNYSVSRYSAVMTKGERVIAVSNVIRDYILKHYPETNPALIRVIPRGIDPAVYFPGYQPEAAWQAAWKKDFPHLAGKQLITLPGRLTRLKGHRDFLQLIDQLRKKYPNIHGLVVGGHEPKQQRYYEEIKQQVTALGLQDAVTFTGHRGDLREIFSMSALVLSLSNKPESFGRTVLEALALGIPVVGYAHGGVGEILSALYPQGRVELGNMTELVRVCDNCLTVRGVIQDPSPFTLEKMLRSTEDVYQSLYPAK
jgi:glycosyltransferase involved in cell wall biosynthesis